MNNSTLGGQMSRQNSEFKSPNNHLETVIRVTRARTTSTGWIGHCPAHDDKNPSLSISENGGKVLVKCHAGCSQEAVMDALKYQGVGLATYPKDAPQRTEYLYQNDSGNNALKVVRVERPGQKKQFFQFKLECGQWRPGKPQDPLRPFLYEEWSGSGSVYLVEGEKCVLALRNAGLAATTTPGGSSAWKEGFAKFFNGMNVVIIPDNDEPGRKYARSAFADLRKLNVAVSIVELPGLQAGEDVADWLKKGGTGAELAKIVSAGASTLAEPPTDSEDNSPDLRVLSANTEWPDPLAAEVFSGPIGEIVSAIAPTSEADPAALYFQLLTLCGASIGRGTWFEIEGARQYPNLFTLVVGKSAKARKGTSLGRIKEVFRHVEPEFLKSNVESGLSSGEGVVHRIRDPKVETKHTDSALPVETVVDEGVSDKRVCFIESELASVLQVLKREGSKLSAILRDAFDGSDLGILTRGNSIKASNPHISIIAHVTSEELKLLMRAVDAFNGFANRFLFVASKRSKLLPLGKSLDIGSLTESLKRLSEGLRYGKELGAISMDEGAHNAFCEVYKQIADDRSGLFGALTSRAEVLALRIAMILAILDKSSVIRRHHMVAGWCLWEYAENSVRHFFGTATGNRTADRIFEELKLQPAGMTTNQIVNLFHRNLSKTEIAAALAMLEHAGSVTSTSDRSTGGRPSERWKLSGITSNDETRLTRKVPMTELNSFNSLARTEKQS